MSEIGTHNFVLKTQRQLQSQRGLSRYSSDIKPRENP